MQNLHQCNQEHFCSDFRQHISGGLQNPTNYNSIGKVVVPVAGLERIFESKWVDIYSGAFKLLRYLEAHNMH